MSKQYNSGEITSQILPWPKCLVVSKIAATSNLEAAENDWQTYLWTVLQSNGKREEYCCLHLYYADGLAPTCAGCPSRVVLTGYAYLFRTTK